MNSDDSLGDAVWKGDTEAVDRFLAAGVDVNASSESGRPPPLWLAIEQQRLEIARRLISAGADVNRDDGDGWTPLVHAIDIESDAAWQRHHEVNLASTDLTELLLCSGSVPTPLAFEIAENYANLKALTLLHRHAFRSGTHGGA